MNEPVCWFYLAEREPLSHVLAPILEKCLRRGWRVLLVGSPEQIEPLDAELWTCRDESFLPHGLDHPQRQPILLSSVCRADNGAKALVVLDMEIQPTGQFERIIFLASRPDRRGVRAMAEKCASMSADDRRCFVQTSGRWHSAESLEV